MFSLSNQVSCFSDLYEIMVNRARDKLRSMNEGNKDSDGKKGARLFGVTLNSSNLHYIRDLALGLHSSEGTSQRLRAVGCTADLTDRGFEPQTSRTDSMSAKQLS